MAALMPVVDRPRTRPDGSPFTEDDKEFWLLEKDGGIRRYQYQPFPKMVYRAIEVQGRVTHETRTVQSAAEWDALGAAWKEHRQEATDYHEGLQRDIARAAAETAHAAQSMTGKAKAEYERKSSATPKHVTE